MIRISLGLISRFYFSNYDSFELAFNTLKPYTLLLLLLLQFKKKKTFLFLDSDSFLYFWMLYVCRYCVLYILYSEQLCYLKPCLLRRRLIFSSFYFLVSFRLASKFELVLFFLSFRKKNFYN